MTGPGHYRAAERLLEEAESLEAAWPSARYLDQAQVCAKLALAASPRARPGLLNRAPAWLSAYCQ